MDEGLKGKLDQIFSANAEKQARARSVREKEVSVQERFLLEFDGLAEQVIKPALTEIGEYAQGNGLPYRIETTTVGKDREGRESMPSIGIVFIEGDPDRYRPSHEYAGWSALGDKRRLKVMFRQRTMGPSRGGVAGSTGEYLSGEVTRDLVQTEVAKVLSEILR